MRGRPPKPTAVLEMSGAYKRNPSRRAARSDEPRVESAVGNPPERWLIPADAVGGPRAARLCAIWHEIAEVAPWLTRSDRMIVEDICELRLRAREGSCKTADRALLAKLMSQCGLDPSSRTRIRTPDDSTRADNPLDKYLKNA